jgi:hypothetical protein
VLRGKRRVGSGDATTAFVALERREGIGRSIVVPTTQCEDGREVIRL